MILGDWQVILSSTNSVNSLSVVYYVVAGTDLRGVTLNCHERSHED